MAWAKSKAEFGAICGDGAVSGVDIDKSTDKLAEYLLWLRPARFTDPIEFHYIDSAFAEFYTANERMLATECLGKLPLAHPGRLPQ